MRGRLIVAALLALAGTGPAMATEDIVITVHPVGAELALPARLIKPDGEGPFPAVVIMHDCSGLGPRSSGSPARWANELVPKGYVVLMPDSFTRRGFPDGVCLAGVQHRERADYETRVADAYGALAALRDLPYVDPARIGVMGGSHGGATTLAAMVAPASADDAMATAKAHPFAAAIALYPRCDAHYGTWSILRQGGYRGPMTAHFGTYKPLAPLLILSGALDDWTPAEACRQMVEVSRAAGHPVEIVVYPNAHHAFDSNYPVRFIAGRSNPSVLSGKGATTGGNPEAWADAKKQVARFFGEKLKK
jgi:dienelactone hydrolase